MTDNKVANSGKSLEERLFLLIILLTITLALFWLLYRVFYFKNTTLIILHSISSSTFSLIYFYYRKTRSFQISALVYYFVMMVFLSFGYFPSGGINGAAVIFSIIVYCTGLLVLPPRFFIFFSVIYITLLFGLFLVEYMFPEMVTRPELGRKMLLAKIVTNTTFFVVLGVLLYYFKKEYVMEYQTKKMQSERLSKEKERLENSERYKAKFLKTIWSEMNAPLAGMELTLKKLENQAFSDNQKILLNRLNKDSELLKSILSDVIEVSQIGMGKATLRRITFDLNNEIHELIEVLESVESSAHTIYEYQKGSDYTRLVDW